MQEKTTDSSHNYDRIARFYDLGAKIFSTNQIRSSKRHQLKYISAGDRVLYLGAGGGEEAIQAAQLGAEVTCIDISQSMLDRIQKKLDSFGLTAELICDDAFRHDRIGYYDVCAVNYFLNVFQQKQMVCMLNHSVSLVKPGGKYLIADVALPQGNCISRTLNWSYLKLAMSAYWILGLVPWHENYDYVKYFSESKLRLEHIEYFRFARRGPILFQSIVASKIDGE